MTSPLIILAIVFLFYGLPLMVYHNVLPATFHKILSAVFCVGSIARKGEKRREKDLQTRVSRREKLAGLEKTGTAGPEQLALYSTPDEVDETTRVGISRRVVLGQLMKVSIFTLFILFPRLVHVAVSLFHCKDVGSSGSFILNYMSDECYDDVWHSYVPLSALFLVIYGAILPGTLAYLLFRERTNLDSPLTILRYGAIYEGYLPARSWFEAVDILTKMFIAIIIPFMDPSYQLSLTTAILTCYLMSLLFFSPYYRKGDDRLHIAAILVVLLTAYVGHVFQFIERDAFSTSSGAGYGVSDSSKVAIVVLLTYCIVAFILYFIFQLFYIVKFNRKTSRNEKEKRGESRAHKLSLIYQSDTQKSPKPLKPLTSYRKQLKEHRKSNDNLSENVERNAKRATDYKITTSQSNQNLPNRRFSVFILENDAEDDSSNHDAVHEPLLISNSASPPASVPPPTRRGGLSVQNSDMPEVNEADQKIFTANATARRGAVMPKPPILPKENKDMFAEPARRRAITNMDALDAPVIDKNAFVDNTIRRGGVISQSVDPEVLAQVNKNMFSDNNERRRGVTTVPPPNLDPTSNELPTE